MHLQKHWKIYVLFCLQQTAVSEHASLTAFLILGLSVRLCNVFISCKTAQKHTSICVRVRKIGSITHKQMKKLGEFEGKNDFSAFLGVSTSALTVKC